MKKNFAQEITPIDDAFHGSPKRMAAEWWYFDALLNDDISIHVGFKTFTKKNRGFFSPIIDIYENGKLKYASTNKFLFRRVKISKDIPYINLFEKPILTFDQNRYEKTNEWCYNVKMKIKDLSVDLDFIGLTKGWKIETPMESWTVAQPNAKVTGKIGIKNKTINVEGTGYHDHNWNYSLLTMINYGIGWYWGKIRSETITVTWANIIKSSKKYEILSVVNQDGKGFFNINPATIIFKPEKFIKDHRGRTPTKFTFIIKDNIDNDKIKADVIMDTEELHFDKILMIPYWRHHVKAKGSISIGDKTEPVKNIQIMEYIKFG